MLKKSEVLSDPTPVLQIIGKIFDLNGEIKDDASENLKYIREHRHSLSSSVTTVMRRIINSGISNGSIAENVTPVVREGRVVIPVEAMYKKNIKGIVQGESATGRTIYIEPAEIVQINNEIRQLDAEEQREILAILTKLTSEIREYESVIEADIDFVIYLDFVKAKALYAHEIGGHKPFLSKKPELEWYHAINPLLLRTFSAHNKDVVPLNIKLDPHNRILVISGPNAGGKSVTLKTVGVIQYMTQCGVLPPLYSNSHVGLFEKIFIDIGDNQSIENELSTYSSHIKNMKNLLSHAEWNTLFLIDEFGSGTEPIIGGAIAEAILLELNRKKSWGIVTTHYQNLKNLAENTDGLINGSMLYDRHLMQPLYTLSVGSAGSSFALEIARKAGLPRQIIDKATEIVGQEYVDSDKFLLDINRDKKYWEQKRYDIKIKEKKIDTLIEEWEKSSLKLKNERKKIIDDAKKEANEIITKANATIERTIREIKEAQAQKDTTRKLRKELDEFKSRLENEHYENINLTSPKKHKRKGTKIKTAEVHYEKRTFEKGDIVQLDNGDITGDIISINGDKATVNFGLTKMTVPVDRLSHSKEKKAQKVKISSSLYTESQNSIKQRREKFKSQIDVRGMRVDEALQAITYFIDDAIQFDADTVKILHGTGTGALRSAIRQHLGAFSANLRYYDEDVRLGGAGITVVQIKK